LCPVLPLDVATVSRYGVLKAALQKKGRPIPENDLWIAASAVQHLILATRDRHFEQVDSLQMETW
jgi:tRNA(fMet)-specific endonuclease VapC